MAFIAEHHRHHKPPRGMKFAIGVKAGDALVGVVTAGRPVARAYDHEAVIEVNRTCTDGTANANSMLYGAARRTAVGMGYQKIVTYTEDGETGASMRAGWVSRRRGAAGPWLVGGQQRDPEASPRSRRGWRTSAPAMGVAMNCKKGSEAMKTPREVAHAYLVEIKQPCGFCPAGTRSGGWVSLGVEHSHHCNLMVAVVVSRDAEHAARLATLVGDLKAIVAGASGNGWLALSRIATRLDAESSGPAIPDGTKGAGR